MKTSKMPMTFHPSKSASWSEPNNHADYASLKDEELIFIYKRHGDQVAFEELLLRYNDLLRRRSERVALISDLNVDDLYNKYLHQFWKAVETYDFSRGAGFKTFLVKEKLSKGASDVIRTQRLRKRKKRYDPSLPHKPQPVEDEVFKQIPVEQAMTDSLIVQDVIEYVRSKSVLHGNILVMMLDGYTYEEIAEWAGKKGNPAALRNWVSRQKKKIAEFIREYYKNSEK